MNFLLTLDSMNRNGALWILPEDQIHNFIKTILIGMSKHETDRSQPSEAVVYTPDPAYKKNSFFVDFVPVMSGRSPTDTA